MTHRFVPGLSGRDAGDIWRDQDVIGRDSDVTLIWRQWGHHDPNAYFFATNLVRGLHT